MIIYPSIVLNFFKTVGGFFYFTQEMNCFFEDATKIVPEQLPDINLICGGFPCQSFSIAGARKGFGDTRGTLFLLQELLPLKDLSFYSLRTSKDFLTMTKARRLKQSSLHWMDWGIVSHGRCLTAKILKFPNPGIVCTLSDVLEKNVAEKYFLLCRQVQKLLYKGNL